MPRGRPIRDDRKNYAIVTNDDAKLFINPNNEDIKKVSTYSDFVSYDEETGLYTVTFRDEMKQDEQQGQPGEKGHPARPFASGQQVANERQQERRQS